MVGEISPRIRGLGKLSREEPDEAEAEFDKTRLLPDKKQIIGFLINKGQEFFDLLFHSVRCELVGHVLGDLYRLSSYNGHIAHPGGTKIYHTDPMVDAASHERQQEGFDPYGVDQS